MPRVDRAGRSANWTCSRSRLIRATGTAQPRGTTAKRCSARTAIHTASRAAADGACTPAALTVEMGTERPLPRLLGGLGCSLALLHDFVDGERLAEQSLALRGLDRSASDLRIPNHDDGEALRLARLRVGDQHGVLDGHEGREQLSHLLDLDSRVKIANVDLEHRHDAYSLWPSPQRGDLRPFARIQTGTHSEHRQSARKPINSPKHARNQV